MNHRYRAGLLFSCALSLASSLAATGNAAPPAKSPLQPVVIQTDKDAYTGKDYIHVALENPNKQTIWVQPFITIDRSNGDGTYAPVYRLLVASKCPKPVPEKPACVRLKPGQRLELVPWDWNTGGYHQCPPRRPGHRAFKGVHRLHALWCEGRPPIDGISRIKHVTFE
jgi:hypothetical protein